MAYFQGQLAKPTRKANLQASESVSAPTDFCRSRHTPYGVSLWRLLRKETAQTKGKRGRLFRDERWIRSLKTL